MKYDGIFVQIILVKHYIHINNCSKILVKHNILINNCSETQFTQKNTWRAQF